MRSCGKLESLRLEVEKWINKKIPRVEGFFFTESITKVHSTEFEQKVVLIESVNYYVQKKDSEYQK